MGNTHCALLLTLNCSSLPLPPPLWIQVSFSLCFSCLVLRNEQLECCGRSDDVKGVRGWMGSVDVTLTWHKAEHVVRGPAGKVVPADAAEQVLSSSHFSFQSCLEGCFLILYCTVQSFCSPLPAAISKSWKHPCPFCRSPFAWRDFGHMAFIDTVTRAP